MTDRWVYADEEAYYDTLCCKTCMAHQCWSDECDYGPSMPCTHTQLAYEGGIYTCLTCFARFYPRDLAHSVDDMRYDRLQEDLDRFMSRR
jgi:hypothetical protein